MKTFVAAMLIGIQFAAPLSSAEAATPFATAGDGPQVRAGAFAGARLRIALGGKNHGRARAGLTFAATQQVRAADSRQTMRFGEGFELGLASGERPAVRLGGMRLTADLGDRVGDDRLGVSTIGAAGIAGGVIVAGLVIYALAVRNSSD